VGVYPGCHVAGLVAFRKVDEHTVTGAYIGDPVRLIVRVNTRVATTRFVVIRKAPLKANQGLAIIRILNAIQKATKKTESPLTDAWSYPSKISLNTTFLQRAAHPVAVSGAKTVTLSPLVARDRATYNCP
jgi:hypothetical protein